jgi:hypothetical protein
MNMSDSGTAQQRLFCLSSHSAGNQNPLASSSFDLISHSFQQQATEGKRELFVRWTLPGVLLLLFLHNKVHATKPPTHSAAVIRLDPVHSVLTDVPPLCYPGTREGRGRQGLFLFSI